MELTAPKEGLHYYPGQKVVCLVKKWGKAYDDWEVPAYNEILTVSKIVEGFLGPGLFFVGFSQRPRQYFFWQHFRPLEKVDQGEDCGFFD